MCLTQTYKIRLSKTNPWEEHSECMHYLFQNTRKSILWCQMQPFSILYYKSHGILAYFLATWLKRFLNVLVQRFHWSTKAGFQHLYLLMFFWISHETTKPGRKVWSLWNVSAVTGTFAINILYRSKLRGIRKVKVSNTSFLSELVFLTSICNQ